MIMKMYSEDVVSQLLFSEEPYAQGLSGKNYDLLILKLQTTAYHRPIGIKKIILVRSPITSDLRHHKLKTYHAICFF